jgi:amino acid transporter
MSGVQGGYVFLRCQFQGGKMEPTHDPQLREKRVYDEERARERFGGANLGAAFFGWLVAVGLTALLTGILAVVATAIGYEKNITQSEAERSAGTVTFVTAIVLLAVLLLAYYAGGYVAGRMSRFDGARQGVAMWFVGLLITIVAAVLGWVAGEQYNLLDRVDVPRIPIPTDDVTMGGIITGVLVLLGTLLAAVLGGLVGRRYHTRVDRAAY